MSPRKPSSFGLFSALPAELRLAIWQFSCHPRVVEVWYDADADRCRTTARPPPVLHVSREARHEAMALYRRAFVTQSCPDHFIYFSSARDVLYLPRHGLMGYDDTARDFTVHVRDTAPHVWSLAIDHVRTDTIRPWEPYNKLMLIFSFPNVQETILVVGAGSNERRVDRRRSLDSVESAESTTSAVSTASLVESAPVPKIGDVELVDPKGDTVAVMGVIDNVIESFSREIQAAAGGPSLSDDCPVHEYPHIPSLIPKAKEYHQYQNKQRRRRRQRHQCAIGCA
ncbi:hypothetical protein CMQ_3779 [Grosmannia clavigera kw1407]|uniref:2EXR domain-containing protein n=1 Tax=Grosmannia clavigera (strain kw1407 / UAMH 11150) TaxID=655863 RepID=F0X8K1_GROCL|nr:uncharacterized protein CMQ_3779 [Grosmannia clavigera kw1407]EFX05710.1 hypothetical protein CMQ_3779 [Grosmannia clavigera kw1407]